MSEYVSRAHGKLREAIQVIKMLGWLILLNQQGLTGGSTA